jgi:three-Cys-motif partner protein
MGVRETHWELLPHTQAKHEILRRYLEAWLPIMATWQGRIVFVDGFAGPGRYSGGEPGSPLIALHTLLEHEPFERLRPGRKVVFIFRLIRESGGWAPQQRAIVSRDARHRSVRADSGDCGALASD